MSRNLGNILSRSVANKLAFCNISSSARLNDKLSLKTPIAEFDKERGSGKASHKPFDTQITKLENGIRVASEEHFGEYCTVGVVIDCGPRYEASYTKGVSHILEKLAFSSSLKHGSREEIYSVIEKNGALVDCQSTKDSFIYAASCHREGLDAIMEIISNSAWRCNISPDELKEARMIVDFENEDMGRKIECEPLLTDWLHKAAFRSNTVGFSKYCSPENTLKVTREELFTYISQYFVPTRIVVGGVGVPHDELVDVTRKYFDERSTIWAMQPNLILPEQPPLDHSIAQYTGGEVRIEKDLSKQAVGTPYPHLAHVGLGFQGVGFKDPDFVAFCVLQSLLGGGGSFSAGGPGKGMFTRLYVDVLNRCHWMYRATAFNHSYADTGLFCIQASSPPEMIGDTLTVIADQFFRLTAGVEDEELNRAKIQLKSQLMMNLEIRPVMFEDLSRQIVGHGYRRKPQEYMDKIDAVTNEDVVKVAERMLSSRPSLVGYGVLEKLQSFEQLDSAVAKRQSKLLLAKPKIFSFS